MSNFLPAYNLTMRNEGGWANTSGDKGGETYKGISRVYHPGWQGWAVIDAFKKQFGIRPGQLINDAPLEEMVRSFYLANFWNRQNLGQINNQSLANLCFDMVVQHGYGPREINKALNEIQAIPITNQLTADSVRIMNTDPQNSYDFIVQQRMEYIDSLNLGSLYAGVMARAKSYLNKYSAAATGGIAVLAGFFLSTFF